MEHVARNKPEAKKKPTIVTDYNNTMRRADQASQHLSDYSVIKKPGQCDNKKIFFHLIEFALWNTYVFYRKCGDKLSYLEYCMELTVNFFKTYEKDDCNYEMFKTFSFKAYSCYRT